MLRRRPIRYLATGEGVEIDVRKHWSALADPALQLAGVILAALLLGSLMSPADGSDFFDDFLSVVVVFFIFRFFFYVWLWYVNRIVVTNQRIIEESGIINRNVSSMPLTKVTDLQYHRSLMGRLLGFGELSLETAGQKQAISSIDHLAKPDEFYRDFTTLLARKQGPSTSPAPASVPVVSDPSSEDVAEERDDDDTGPIERVVV
jgi:uncharacterized membrane protein YdbT with pleckstrin-like domain